MAYQAIYRKWRPLSFEDVVGQQHIMDTLKAEVKSGRIAHAYLFCGTRGTGKTTTAKILSRAVNCLTPLANGNPCNVCETCKGILSGGIVDVVEIDAASNNGVDNIRELRDEIVYTPSKAKYKVYIIDETHMLSPGAFNALLKTLEEPPSHAIFILATTEPHKVPATIQSRCQRFDFRRISARHIAGRIGEIVRGDGINITPDAVRLVAELGDGSMRDALSILDLCAGIEGEITRADIENVAGVASKDVIFEIAYALVKADVSSSIVLLSRLIGQGRECIPILEALIAQFRDLLLCKMLKEPETALDQSEENIEKYKNTDVSIEFLLHAIHALSGYTTICKTSDNPQVLLEAAFVKICLPETDASSEAFAARLARLESGQPVIQQIVPAESASPEPPKRVAAMVPPEPPLPEQDEDPAPYIPEQALSEPALSEPTPSELPTTVEFFAPPPPPAVVPPNVNYNDALSRLSTTNPAVASLLMDTQCEIRGGTAYIVFENEFYRDTVARNTQFVSAIADAVGCTGLKFVTQSWLDYRDTPTDPLEALIAKSETMDQISIF